MNDLQKVLDQFQSTIELCTQEAKAALTEFEKAAGAEQQRVLRDMSAAWNEAELEIAEQRRKIEEDLLGMRTQLQKEVDALQAEKGKLEAVVGKMRDELKKVGLL